MIQKLILALVAVAMAAVPLVTTFAFPGGGPRRTGAARATK